MLRPTALLVPVVTVVSWALASSCAPVFGRRPEDRVVTVALNEPRAAAVRRTLAAFRDQGYRVREGLTSGREIVSEPFRHANVVATFVAVIAESDGRSRVELSGTFHERQFGGVARGAEQEIVRAEDGVRGELWVRLQNLALALRTPP